MLVQQPKVWANVVSYNRLHLLQKCIAALRSQTVAPTRIVVVDNGSTDGSAEWLRGQQDSQLLLVEQGNLGSAGGQFSGVQSAYNGGADWIWMMDDDVIPDSNALEQLLHAVKLKPAAGLFCSRVTDGSGETEVNSPVFDFQDSRFGYYPQWTRTLAVGLVPIKRCTFVSCFVKAEILAEVGLPLAEFFIWHDDYEFTRRVTNRYPGYFVANSVVRHLREDVRRLSYKNVTDPSRMGMFYYFFRNKVALLRRESDSRKSALFRCAVYYFKSFGGILRYQPKLRLLIIFNRGFLAGIKFRTQDFKPEPRRGGETRAQSPLQ